MDASHVSGAALGATLGAILAAALHRYHVTAVTDAEAALIGAAFVALGVGIAHALWTIGLGPIFSRIIHGPSRPQVAPPVTPPPPTVGP